MSDTPTPETDLKTMDGIIRCCGGVLADDDYRLAASGDGSVVAVEFARRLERERDQARMKFKDLKRAAIEVLKIVPVAHCSDMHHGKRDMHSALEPCPVVDRYNAKIDKLRALLKEEA